MSTNQYAEGYQAGMTDIANLMALADRPRLAGESEADLKAKAFDAIAEWVWNNLQGERSVRVAAQAAKEIAKFQELKNPTVELHNTRGSAVDLADRINADFAAGRITHFNGHQIKPRFRGGRVAKSWTNGTISVTVESVGSTHRAVDRWVKLGESFRLTLQGNGSQGNLDSCKQ